MACEYQIMLERVAKDKRSSLFGPFTKKSFLTLPPGLAG
jgi:hypothetical protein